MRKRSGWLLASLTVALTIALNSSASATTAIQVVDESTNTVCSALVESHTKGGCKVHMTGTVTLQGWAFTWFDEGTCIVETEMRLSGSGIAAIDDVDFYDGDANCDGVGGTSPITPCDLPWEGSGERVSATVIHASKAVCLNASELDVCGSTVEYDIIEGGKADAETYSATFVNSNVGSVCRLNGTISMEATVPGNTPIHVN